MAPIRQPQRYFISNKIYLIPTPCMLQQWRLLENNRQLLAKHILTPVSVKSKAFILLLEPSFVQPEGLAARASA